MPQQPSSRMFPKVLFLLLIATIIVSASVFLSLKDEEAAPIMEENGAVPEATEPTEEVVNIQGPTTTPQDIVTPPIEAPVEAPAISASVEAQIQAINRRVDAGELTLEEAQGLINKLLGI